MKRPLPGWLDAALLVAAAGLVIALIGVAVVGWHLEQFVGAIQ